MRQNTAYRAQHTKDRTKNIEHREKLRIGTGRVQSIDKRTKGEGQKNLSSEKGIALVMVLVISAISLAIMAGLIFMVTSGTQTSGLHKRYKTALEAAKGGTDITLQIIDLRADPSFIADLVAAALSPVITINPLCSGTDRDGIAFTGLQAKFLTSTDSWTANCDSVLTIDPSAPTTYDVQFDVGAGPTYTIYAKIVDTVEGNTEMSVWAKDVFPPVPGSSSFIVPFLYTVEIDTENTVNPAERAKLSVLYQY